MHWPEHYIERVIQELISSRERGHSHQPTKTLMNGSSRCAKPHVDFYHTEYQEYERYPFGLLNVVGYWAEAKLLGGVLLFDRGDTGLEVRWHC